MFSKLKLLIIFILSLIYLLLSPLALSGDESKKFIRQINLGMINQTKFIRLPTHDFFYKIELAFGEFSDGALQDKIPSHATKNIIISRDDSKNISAKLKINDPAMGDRPIWTGEVYFNQDLQQLTYRILQEDEHYLIDIKILQRTISTIPKFQIGIISL